MAKTEKVVIEGEIVSPTKPDRGRFKSYQSYTTKPTDGALVGVWLFSITCLFLSIIPYVGLVLAILSLVACLVKKIPPILPILSIIISLIVTSIFIVIWAILGAIF